MSDQYTPEDTAKAAKPAAPAAPDAPDGAGKPDMSADMSAAPRRHSWLRRYMAIPTLAGIGLVVYLIFFGENSISQRVVYQHAIDSLTECLRVQRDSLEYYRDLNRRLTTDPELMEQVVREQYNMNRPNEDVFIIE